MTNPPNPLSRATSALLALSIILASSPAPRAWGAVAKVAVGPGCGPMSLNVGVLNAAPSLGSSARTGLESGSLDLPLSHPASAPHAAPPAAAAGTAGSGVIQTIQRAAGEISAIASGDGKDAFTSGVSEIAQQMFDGGGEKGASSQGPSDAQGAGAAGGADDGGRDAYPTKNVAVLPAPEVLFPHAQPGFSVRIPKNTPFEDAVKRASRGDGYILLATADETGGFFPVATLARITKTEDKGRHIEVSMSFPSEARILDHEGDPADGAATASVEYPVVAVGDVAGMKKSLETAIALTKGSRSAEVNKALREALTEQRFDKAAYLLASQVPNLDKDHRFINQDVRRSILEAPSVEAKLALVVQALSAGTVKDDGTMEEESELDALRKRIDDSDLSPEAKKAALAEFNKVKRAGEKGGADTEVSRNYIDVLLSLPWTKRSEDRFDLAEAAKILNRDHSWMERVKNRILEYLAVRKRTNSLKGSILCFVGPPGVGKTSIAQAIAEAMGRRFVQIALGGVTDVAEIRGHRRAYVGAAMGTVMQKMREAGTVNPVMLLDEIEKLDKGSQGDPRAALLELLDPAQNHKFRDNYLDVSYDMSQVLFITTANDLSAIPEPLRNRMEIIEFSSYINEEKIAIAKNHIPRILGEHGLSAKDASFTDGALRRIIEDYTSDAGARTLLQKLREVARKVVVALERDLAPSPGEIAEAQIKGYLGDPETVANRPDPNGVGMATGLAVSGYGGAAFNVEVLVNKGGGEIVILHKMKEMMQDSARITKELLESLAPEIGLGPDPFAGKKVVINIPSSEDNNGPSGGVTMAAAIVSRLSGRAVKQGVAMTGEITLNGKVKPIGGLREKILAAHRMGYTTVLYPAANQKDIKEIPEPVRAGMSLIPVETLEQVLKEALEPAAQ